MNTIAIDARYVRERPSGIGAMVEVLLRLVPAMMPEARFLLLRHPQAPRPLSLAANVREVTVRAEANGPGTLLWLRRLVDLDGVRLYHAPHNILPAGLGMATVTTIHDLMWLTDPALCGARGPWGLIQTAYYRNGIRRALRQASKLIAVSAATRDAIAAVDPEAARRTTVVRHGVDPAFCPARSEAERDADAQACRRLLGGAARHVLVVGQSAPYKNQGRAVEAFLQAFQEDPSVQLVLLQRLGRDAQAFVERARSVGAERRVQVLPAVSHLELVALYRGALCLLQPSRVEGWGMPVSEAMASGCPVIASDIDVLREVTGGAALLVDPERTDLWAQALSRMAQEPALRDSLVAAGRSRARRLSWHQHARQTAALYRSLL